MKAKNNKKLKRFVEYMLLIPTLIWVYSPIIAGIIFAMVGCFQQLSHLGGYLHI